MIPEYDPVHVFPNMTAYHVVDRFIFSRVDMAYAEAADRVKNVSESNRPEFVAYEATIKTTVKLITIRNRPGKGQVKQTQTMATFNHKIDTTDAVEDIRIFLNDLRKVLIRDMPPIQDASATCVLTFSVGNKYISSYTSRWI